MTDNKPSPLARLSQQIMRLLGQWQVAEEQFTIAGGQWYLVAPADPFRLAIHIGAISQGSSAASGVLASTQPATNVTNGVTLSDHPVGRGLVYPLWGELVAQTWYVQTQIASQVLVTVTTVRAQQ
jgi:hypothetical protein